MKSTYEKKVTVHGVDIHFREKNSLCEQTLLCLHALGHCSKDYNKIFSDPCFSHYRIIAIDFPGHGDSDRGSKPVSSEYFAEITEEVIRTLSLKKITVLGNSIGGAVAIRLASNPDNTIQSIQLANPAGLDKRGGVSKLFLSFMVWFFNKGVKGAPKFRKWFQYYYGKVLPSPEAAARRQEIVANAYNIAPILAEGWESFKSESEDLRKMASELPCPVLVTWAMKDKKVQYRRNVGAIEKIRNLKLIKYSIGHTPMLENPAVFLADLRRFLDDQQQHLPAY